MNPERTLPFSEVVRINEIGAGLTRRLVPDDSARARIVQALDLATLSSLEANVSVVPSRGGWTLSGQVTAVAEQVCGITLEPLPVQIDERFTIELVETVERETGEVEVDVSLDDDAPDVIEDGRIDLGQYAVEQFSLALDPFPRKPGAEFIQPEESAEISPFAVLKAFKTPGDTGKS